MTIAEFLEARIAEDEVKATLRNWHAEDCGWMPNESGYSYPCDCGVPERMAAECAAKRAVVMSYRSCVEADANTNITTEFGVKLTVSGMVKGLELAAKSLAAVYAYHEDYRQEWA